MASKLLFVCSFQVYIMFPFTPSTAFKISMIPFSSFDQSALTDSNLTCDSSSAHEDLATNLSLINSCALKELLAWEQNMMWRVEMLEYFTSQVHSVNLDPFRFPKSHKLQIESHFFMSNFVSLDGRFHAQTFLIQITSLHLHYMNHLDASILVPQPQSLTLIRRPLSLLLIPKRKKMHE